MKNDQDKKPLKTVDDYLAALPEEQRVALEKLRRIIKSAAPDALEKIGYGMPIFNYKGNLVGYAAFKDHCSLFIMSYKVMDMFKEELKPYFKATATIHFTPDKPLPVTLVKKIVKARIEENEEKKAARKK
jgi:uncharacterized protein YdhG (YjbR/CyaY superfamily)